MQGREHWLSGESTLEDMLADPIVRILMARDGLSEETVRGAFQDAARRLQGRSADQVARATGVDAGVDKAA